MSRTVGLAFHGSGLPSAGRVVIIGPGKLGCGYLAPMFLDAGWEIVLAARTPARAARIREAGGFSVRVSGRSQAFDLPRPPVAVGTRPFREAVGSADLIVTAVGRENVGGLGTHIARALADRASPIDIWIVENADAAPLLERAVRGAAARSGVALPQVGFAGAIAVPIVARGSWQLPGRPAFVRDRAEGLLVDRSRLLRPIPSLPGVGGTSLYREKLREKLFVFNAGHALLAYLGARCGYRRIDQAAGDPLLRTLVEGCLLETRSALVRAHTGLGNAVGEPVAEAMGRYENVELEDTILRVARCPIRKLDPEGPLVGPAKLVRSTFGRAPIPFVLGIVSALLHSDRTDEEALRLTAMLRRNGVRPVIFEVCGLEPDDVLAQAVTVTYQRMRVAHELARRDCVHRRRPKRSAARQPKRALQAVAA